MAKRYPAKLKFQVVLELLQSNKTPGQIAKAYGIHPNTAAKWKQQFLDNGAEVFAQEGTIAEYERRIADLEQLLGKKEVEIALLKNFLEEKQYKIDVVFQRTCGRCNVEESRSFPRNLAAYWPDEGFPSKLRANGARRWGSNPHGGPPDEHARAQPQGRDGYKQIFAYLLSAFPDTQLTIEEIIAEGEKVVTRSTWTGTHQGEFMEKRLGLPR